MNKISYIIHYYDICIRRFGIYMDYITLRDIARIMEYIENNE